MEKLLQKWQQRLDVLDIAFQPILNINTGKIYAVEALLRNHLDAGFRSIFDVFDTTYKENVLYAFDLALREKTFKKFTQINNYDTMKLFYNLDNRLFEMPDFSSGNTNMLLQKYNIRRENICFEISERHEIENMTSMEKILQHYKDEAFYIAIDDFGVGYSGYKLLFDSAPDIIKLDRYFLQNIDKDIKRKLMVKSITHLAIQLGIDVLAEGVETKEEYLSCKEIGCTLVQGYFVQHPTKNTQEIQAKYEHICDLLRSCRRKDNISKTKKYVQQISPIQKSSSMHEVVEYFKRNSNVPYVPIINKDAKPIGILAEAQIKEYLYSPYGISLLLNDEKEKSKLKHLITDCPSIDINSNISMIIELFSNNSDGHGILITKNSKYYGFLTSKDIIQLINEENLIVARDQNPLTKMPGNRLVESYITQSVQNTKPTLLCYYDLDNFKAFNDVYGFRNGDRIIQLFADIISKKLPNSFFKGHIGGDDFFVATTIDEAQENYCKQLTEIITTFEDHAREFYSQEDKENGYIVAKDRAGNQKKFPFLTVSASVLFTHVKKPSHCTESINTVLSLQKKIAKSEKNHLCVSSLL